jgi:tRNA (guanine-N7-)-methyltransferase
VRRPKRLPPELLAPYRLDWPAAGQRITGPMIFGNDRPLEIEVGCGKGGFLVSAAEAQPDRNFLGLEIDRALHFLIAGRLAKRQLVNARIACGDARLWFHNHLADQSLSAIHVYFPDPWWKKRHHKRRLWTPEFAVDCERTLRPGGRLFIATDVGEYYQTMRALLDSRPRLRLVSAEERGGEPPADELLTNFERKALVRGGTTWRAVFEKRDD